MRNKLAHHIPKMYKGEFLIVVETYAQFQTYICRALDRDLSTRVCACHGHQSPRIRFPMLERSGIRLPDIMIFVLQ